MKMEKTLKVPHLTQTQNPLPACSSKSERDILRVKTGVRGSPHASHSFFQPVS